MVEQLRWIREHPPAAARGLNRLYFTRGGYSKGNSNGTRLFEFDWDICIILDACRYDLYRVYADQNDLLGDLDSRQSIASSTPEFLALNFENETHPDTVYVTGNPQYYMHRDELGPTFHECINVWQERWDEDLQTVTPEAMTNALVEASEEYPNKRILAHFVQPHVPFIGPRGRDRFPISMDETTGDSWNAARKFWPSIRRGKRNFSSGKLLHAYVENIESAVKSVIPALESLEGKSIITSDHGQLLGERIYPLPIREYGHPAGIYVDELTETPLHTLPFESRRDVRLGEVLSNEQESVGEEVTSRLNALGYK
jgi:hypothetical protein